MVSLWILVIAIVAALVGTIYYWQAVRPRLRARQRLLVELVKAGEATPPPPRRPLTQRYRLLPWLLAVILAVTLMLLNVPLAICLALGMVTGLLTWQWEVGRLFRVQLQIENQLADVLDLMVGGLRAGSSVMTAMDSAVAETRAPLRPELEDVLARLRMGDYPQEVFQSLTTRVPLETFMLFTSALSVHWEVGGSLAPTLAVVGRAIRDRIALSRRIRALTAEARVSLIAVLAMTYFIALMVWVSDPERMQSFLATGFGAALTAGAVLLQGLGIVWMSILSRLRL
jgi:Flp pilus assembly protein TadB